MRADGSQETEPALEQWCEVFVVKHTLTGECSAVPSAYMHVNSHISSRQKLDKTHNSVLHSNKVEQAYVVRIHGLPSSMSTCFCIPPLWPDLSRSTIRQVGGKKSSFREDLRLSLSLFFFGLSSTLIHCLKVKWASRVNGTSWLRSKLLQRNGDSHELQLKVSCSADRAALYDTKDRKEQGGLEISKERTEDECVWRARVYSSVGMRM